MIIIRKGEERRKKKREVLHLFRWYTHTYIYPWSIYYGFSFFPPTLFIPQIPIMVGEIPKKTLNIPIFQSPSIYHQNNIYIYNTYILYLYIFIYIYISPHQKHHWLVKSTPNKSPALRPKNSRPLEPPPPGWAAWLRWADRWCDPCSPAGARESRTSHRGCDILAISGTHGLEVPSIFSGPCKGIFQTRYVWLVVSTPLKNDGVRQLGWWHSQLNGKS